MAKKAEVVAETVIVYGLFQRVAKDWCVEFPADVTVNEGDVVEVKTVAGEVKSCRIKSLVGVSVPAGEDEVPMMWFTYAKVSAK